VAAEAEGVTLNPGKFPALFGDIFVFACKPLGLRELAIKTEIPC
jgi:hypothetical protein